MIGGRAMRLVRDDDFVELMEPQDAQAPDEPLDVIDGDDDNADPRRAAGGDDDASDAPDAAEHPDGAVEDAAGEGVEGSSSSGASESSEPGEPSTGEIDVDLRTLEALLFSTHHPLTAGRLAELLGLGSTKPIRRAIKDLNEQYVATDRSFRVEQVAGGYQLLTLPEFGEVLKALHQRETDAKLTKAALETLAIIAYKQPILRADVEAIRGVACGETIRSLMEKHLVKIAGRAEIPGRPILYGTTKRFLELFGLNSLKDLPQGEDALRPKA
jgi:segregation and condensation protein B